LSASPAVSLAPPVQAKPLQTPAAAPAPAIAATPAPAPVPGTLAAPSTPASAGSTPATPVDALRLQYEAEGAAELLAKEKAIATAALEPPELKIRMAAAENAAGMPSGGAVATPPLPKADAAPAAPVPGTINPLTGLRVPTPELAAAFLASNPTPAATVKDAAPGTESVSAPSARPTPPKVTHKRASNPERILLVVGGILAVVIGGGLMGVYLYLRAPTKPPAPPIVTEEAPPDESAVASTASTTPEPGSPDAAVASAATTPPATASTGTPPETSPAATSAATGQPPATGEATPAAATTPPAPPPPRVNKPDPTILAWVQKIELTGIRGGPVPKAFMNGKLYEVGEVVNFQLGLKLTEIKGKVLRFEDAEGNTYDYRF
jgi:hypothetical protein